MLHAFSCTAALLQNSSSLLYIVTLNETIGKIFWTLSFSDEVNRIQVADQHDQLSCTASRVLRDCIRLTRNDFLVHESCIHCINYALKCNMQLV